jgi:peptide/nickel transport system permease protein
MAVSGYVARRMIVTVPLLLGVATAIFSLIHLIPGDPVEVMLGPGAGPGDVADLRHRLGLDRPLLLQYAGFLQGLLRGDLGRSLRYGDAVATLLLERFPATLLLSGCSLAVALILALPTGFLAALRPGSPFDRLSAVAAVVGLSMPSFWLGPLLILFFAIRLDWLPVSGLDSPAAIILPSLTLATPMAALVVRLGRATLLEESRSGYLQAARSRGRSRTAAVLRHAAPNALPPVLSVLGLQVGSLLTGAILTETIFGWPGLGRLLVQAITHRDYPLVQGCVLLFAATYVLVNLAVDLLQVLVDPRTAS